MTQINTTLDKLQAANIRLGDTICGYFSGDHPVSTIAGTAAVNTIVKDLRNFFHRKKDMPKTALTSDSDNSSDLIKTFDSLVRNLGNFAKHADRPNDPFIRASYTPIYAMMSLHCTTIDFQNFADDLVGHGFADLQTCHETPEGIGTRTFLLSDMYLNFTKNFWEERQRKETTAAIFNEAAPPSTPSLESKQRVLEKIMEYGLREHNDLEVGDDLELTTSAKEALPRFLLY